MTDANESFEKQALRISLETLATILANQKRLERKVNCIGMLLAGGKYSEGWDDSYYDFEGQR